MTSSLRLLPAALLTALGAAAQNVPPPATPFQMQGNIYLPNKLPATDARVASLKVPAGFTISKFAEGLDMPRMLAVAPNGDVYVTNRVKGHCDAGARCQPRRQSRSNAPGGPEAAPARASLAR